MPDKEAEGIHLSLKEQEKLLADAGRDIPADRANALTVRAPAPVTTLGDLFDETVQELTQAQLALESEAHKRLRRYKFCRVGVAFLMCLGVLATLGLNIQSLGLDMFFTRVSPIIMTGALFFYILEALLRDHEVSWECGREAGRLKSLVRRARIDWVSRGASHDQATAVHILTDLNEDCMRLDSLMVAERVPPIQEILKRLQERKTASRKVQKS